MPYAPWGTANADTFGLLAGVLAGKAEQIGNTEGKDASEATAADENGPSSRRPFTMNAPTLLTSSSSSQRLTCPQSSWASLRRLRRMTTPL